MQNFAPFQIVPALCEHGRRSMLTFLAKLSSYGFPNGCDQTLQEFFISCAG